MADEWVLVPREPTDAMKRAAFGPILHGGRGGPLTSDYIRQQAALTFWPRMLAAAPPPPVREEMEGDMREVVMRIIDEAVTRCAAFEQGWEDAKREAADSILALPSVPIPDDETLAQTLYEAMVPPGSGPASLARWASWDEIKESGAGGERYRIGVRALKAALLSDREPSGGAG